MSDPNMLAIMAKLTELQVSVTTLDTTLRAHIEATSKAPKSSKAEGAAATAASKPKSTPNINKWFEENFKKSPEFKARYCTADIDKIVAENAETKDLKESAKKSNLIASLVYKKVMELHPELYKKLNDEYAAFVASTNATNAADVQGKELHSDEEKGQSSTTSANAAQVVANIVPPSKEEVQPPVKKGRAPRKAAAAAPKNDA